MEIRLHIPIHIIKTLMFKIDLIVWKLYSTVQSKSNYCWFKIDLIVWK